MTHVYTTICISSLSLSIYIYVYIYIIIRISIVLKYCWEQESRLNIQLHIEVTLGKNLSGHFRYWKNLTANLFRSFTRLELIPTTDLKTVSATMVQATRPPAELRLVLATPVRTASFMLRRPPMELRRRPSCSCSFHGTSHESLFFFHFVSKISI